MNRTAREQRIWELNNRAMMLGTVGVVLIVAALVMLVPTQTFYHDAYEILGWGAAVVGAVLIVVALFFAAVAFSKAEDAR